MLPAHDRLLAAGTNMIETFLAKSNRSPVTRQNKITQYLLNSLFWELLQLAFVFIRIVDVFIIQNKCKEDGELEFDSVTISKESLA